MLSGTTSMKIKAMIKQFPGPIGPWIALTKRGKKRRERGRGRNISKGQNNHRAMGPTPLK